MQGARFDFEDSLIRHQSLPQGFMITLSDRPVKQIFLKDIIAVPAFLVSSCIERCI